MHFHLQWHGTGLRSLIHLYIAYRGISIAVMTCSAEESPFVCCASKQVITRKSTKDDCTIRTPDMPFGASILYAESFTSAMPEKYSRYLYEK
jgi:hypothetical protein